MKIKKLALAMAFVGSTAFAQTSDYSLGTGDWTAVSGQTLTGAQTFQAGPNAWSMSPYTGSTMYNLQPQAPSNTYANMAAALGMSSSSVSAFGIVVNSEFLFAISFK